MIEKTITDNAVSDLLRIALAHPACNTSFMSKTCMYALLIKVNKSSNNL